VQADGVAHGADSRVAAVAAQLADLLHLGFRQHDAEALLAPIAEVDVRALVHDRRSRRYRLDTAT
jgi:hypothetical protein